MLEHRGIFISKVNWLSNTVDALWIQKEQGVVKEIKTFEKKVHFVHHLLHLAYGSAVLGLSVLVHVLISHHIQNTAKTVHWDAGEIETNFIIHPVHQQGLVQIGVAEDGTVVWRIKK